MLRPMQPVRSFPVVVAVGLLLVSSAASAQSTEGAFQVGLTTPIFGYAKSSIEYEDETEVDISGVSWGIREQVLLELGYGLSESVVLGGIVSVGGASQSAELNDPDISAEDSDASSLVILLGPKLDLQFGEGAARPFVGGNIAFLSASAEDEGSETATMGFQLSGRAGVRWFPTPGFSLDPAFTASYVHASGEIEPDESDPIDVSQSGFSLMLTVGASGWID